MKITDFIKILLCTFGFDHDIQIEYDRSSMTYDIHATNRYIDDELAILDVIPSQVTYMILAYMRDNKIGLDPLIGLPEVISGMTDDKNVKR